MFLHYDMDCFFASIEMRDNPKLKNVPLAVGTHVVATCNYSARKYGVRSAQSINLAKKLCNNLVVVKARTDYYFYIGKKIQNMIKKFFENAVFLSCDEGYIEFNIPNDEIENFCKAFKKMIQENFNLSVSIGVGFTNIVAKMACEVNKPNGIFILDTKDKFINYVYDKKINIFPGIGTKTFDILYKSGIIYTRDVYSKSKEDLVKILGKSVTTHLLDMVRGKLINDTYDNNIEKSISKEKTFYPFISSKKQVYDELKYICKILLDEIIQKKKYPLTITVKVKKDNFEVITKSKTFNSPINRNSDILLITKQLFELMQINENIRLIGISMSNFTKFKYEYLKLFGE